MSADPNRFDWRATPDASSPLQQGNRVLESIARQEALRSLLAFSDLREQIRNRRRANGRAADRDLFETERFILDEVLQLICDRAQILTHADGIMVALAEGPYMACRASCGTLAVDRGLHLAGESKFLQECLETGNILRCDDCKVDARVTLDLAPRLGARSTVLVPLRGRHEQLGVLQAFSTLPRAFSDHDVRNFDLFAELVLSALKPEDQDRRIGWLSGVADEVLHAKPTVIEPIVAEPIVAEPSAPPGAMDELSSENVAIEEPVAAAQSSAPLPVPQSLSTPGSSCPGLSIVLSLVVVAALFSGAAWWAMRDHNAAIGEMAAAVRTATAPRAIPRHTVTTPSSSPADVLAAAGAEGLTLDLQINSPNAASGAPSGIPADAKGMSKITGVRHWSSPTGSTVVIDMEDEVPYEVHRLASPERIYFDLHGTSLAPELDAKTMDVGDAALTRVRIGQPVAGITRVVLDTKNDANFSVSMESNPYRLVVELRGSDKTASSSRVIESLTPDSATKEQPLASAAPVVALQPKPKPLNQALAARSGRFRVVLDAGHGGWDLGTVGRQGLLEKDLVLDVTKRLGKLLEARLGSEVVFTRTDDTYLPLDQRADIANQAQADLFVSVHGNYSSSAAARGVETYYTNLFSAPGLREVEKHDDGTLAKLMPVSLSAEGLHEKIEESRRLAASVQRSLYATLASNNPDIRNRGIKDAAFVVLTGTTMPSILTEISFVSSPADERNLQSETYRQEIAEALYQGIARYQQSSPRAKIAQLQTPAARR
jgi:N-acetylmuramoyl-L-alanine amidase